VKLVDPALVHQEPSTTKPTHRSASWVVILIAFVFVGLLVIGTAAAASYETWAAVLVGLVIVAASIPALARQGKRERDRRIFWLLLLALVLKLGAGVAANYVAFDLYGGQADLSGYHKRGVEVAERFRAGNFDPGLKETTGTAFPILLNGIIYTVIGPTKLGGFLVHSWLAFWGLFLFYRAFTIAFPEGRSRSYARLLFFLPSEVLWSSFMGKEPWMVLSLGVAAFGVAKMLSGRTWRGLAVAGLGMWMATLIRPHVAAMAGLALAFAFLARRPRRELAQLGPVVKVFSLGALAVVALLLVGNTERFLEKSNVETKKGITRALEDTSSGGSYGGSAFTPSIVDSPAKFPAAAITVLFRPFPTEVGNTQALATAAEGVSLMLLCLARLPWIVAAARRFRDYPYVVFGLAYTVLFIIGFSSFANFGLLARQRVQLYPFFLVILAVPKPHARVPWRSARRVSAGGREDPAATGLEVRT